MNIVVPEVKKPVRRDMKLDISIARRPPAEARYSLNL